MAITFSIPTSIITLHEKACADIIAQLGKSCKLFYPPLRNTCPNCTGGYTYIGGPYPFQNGMPCPYCNATNIVESEITPDTITMMVYMNPKDFIKYQEFNLNIPSSAIQSRGLMSDLNKVQRCNFMQIMSIDGIETLRYKKVGEAVPFGLMLREEFLQMWDRAM